MRDFYYLFSLVSYINVLLSRCILITLARLPVILNSKQVTKKYSALIHRVG